MLAFPFPRSRVVAMAGVLIGALPVIAWAATESPGVSIIAVARLDVGLPPVVIAIAVVGAATASATGGVDVPLVVARVVIARVEIHKTPSVLAGQRYNALVNVELTPDQRAFVKKAIESGRFTREEEAVQEALALWEERERRRLEILAMLDEADAELARGEGIPITEESMKALAAEIKERLRRRIAAERSATSR